MLRISRDTLMVSQVKSNAQPDELALVDSISDLLSELRGSYLDAESELLALEELKTPFSGFLRSIYDNT